MGVSDLPACKPYDFLCQIARQAAKSAVYDSWAQEHVVQVRGLASVTEETGARDIYKGHDGGAKGECVVWCRAH